MAVANYQQVFIIDYLLLIIYVCVELIVLSVHYFYIYLFL